MSRLIIIHPKGHVAEITDELGLPSPVVPSTWEKFAVTSTTAAKIRNSLTPDGHFQDPRVAGLLVIEDIRLERLRRIRSTDEPWGFSDLPESPKRTAWHLYRTKLRDITNQTDPNNVIWPTPPEF